jgi:hypothetical protein
VQLPLLADNAIFGDGSCDTISKKASGMYKVLHPPFHLTYPTFCFIALVSEFYVSCTNLFSMYDSSFQFLLYLFLLFSIHSSVILIFVPFSLIYLLLFLFLSPFTF